MPYLCNPSLTKGKCEYYLPFTSKDRMIKNIILDAIRLG